MASIIYIPAGLLNPHLEKGVVVTSLKHLVLLRPELITEGTIPPGGCHRTSAVLPTTL